MEVIIIQEKFKHGISFYKKKYKRKTFLGNLHYGGGNYLCFEGINVFVAVEDKDDLKRGLQIATGCKNISFDIKNAFEYIDGLKVIYKLNPDY
jgi:hypothetical protein